jgi:hypothetical protein
VCFGKTKGIEFLMTESSATIQNLLAEMSEARQFSLLAKQPGVKELLEQYVENIQAELKRQEVENSKKKTEEENISGQKIPAQASSVSLFGTAKQHTITTYSWDESDTEVKIYFSLPPFPKRPITSIGSRKKIGISIFSSQESKTLRVLFALFEEGVETPCDLYSFVASPLKHELENVAGSYILDSQTHKNSNINDDDEDPSSSSNYFFSTPNSGFVYPGETTTPAGNILRYCRLKVKEKKGDLGDVVIGVQKVMPGPWADLIDKDDFNKPLAFSSTGGRSRNDPNLQQGASLVSLMQQLYKDGDDEMKKTIAQAWEESRHMPPPQ